MGQGSGVLAAEFGSDVELKEKYFIQKVKLGEGSCGNVWRAVNKKTQEPVAMKQVVRDQVLLNAGRKLDACKQEITVLRALKHEHIVQLFEAFTDSYGNLYIALEYCDGGDLGDKLVQMGESFRVADVIAFTRQILSAVSYLHGNLICHRDIKPNNFMVSSCSNSPLSHMTNVSDKMSLKLVDFGLAVKVDVGQLLTQRCGTPAFMAPEQHTLPPKGTSKGYGCAADNWASGVTMYCILSNGQHPFVNHQGLLDEEAAVQGRFSFRCDSSTASFFPGIAKSKQQPWPSEAFDLCGRLMSPNVEKRIPADRALEHPFLTASTSGATPQKTSSRTLQSSPYSGGDRDPDSEMSRPLVAMGHERDGHICSPQKPSQCDIGCCTLSCSVKSHTTPFMNPLMLPLAACNRCSRTRRGSAIWGIGDEVHEVVETEEDHELEVISLRRKLPQVGITGPAHPNAFYEIV